MKVLIQDGLSAHHYWRLGLANAFIKLGNSVQLWNEKIKSEFDTFSEFEPDIFITSSFQLNRAIIKNIIKRPHLKVLIYTHHYGQIDSELSKKYPIGISTDEEKKNIEFIIKNHSGKIVGFSQYPEYFLKESHNYWQNIGLDVKSSLLAADTTVFYPEYNEKYQCDLFIVSGWWQYKSEQLDKYITPLFFPLTKLNIKVAGNGWNQIQSLGYINDNTARKFYSSSKTNINIFESHSLEIPDYNGRLWTIPACKGLQISQNVYGINDYFDENEIITFDNQKDFLEKLSFYIKNEDKTQEIKEKSYQKIINFHTYEHRILEILNFIG